LYVISEVAPQVAAAATPRLVSFSMGSASQCCPRAEQLLSNASQQDAARGLTQVRAHIGNICDD
jgi:hypothetical protein